VWFTSDSTFLADGCPLDGAFLSGFTFAGASPLALVKSFFGFECDDASFSESETLMMG
jgi:hypothetical protein